MFDIGIKNSFLYSAYKVHSSFSSRFQAVTRSGTGTGFIVSTRDGLSAFLVTCRHNLDPTYFEPVKYAGFELEHLWIEGFVRPTADKSNEDLPVNRQKAGIRPDAVRFHEDDSVDIAIVRLDHQTIVEPIPDGPLNFGFTDGVLANSEDFDNSLTVGETILFPGYPTWNDKNGDRPVLRTGTIVSDPRSDYRKSDGEPRRRDGRHQIAFEAFSFSGNSGSPVYVLQRGMPPESDITFGDVFHRPMIIGVNAGHVNLDDGTHSGLSYLYKATAVRSMIDS